MSLIPKFAAYASAFEKAYESDDWSSLERYFHEDAVYEIGLPLLGAERCDGRPAILAWFREVVDRFDRRFDSRTLELHEGPVESPGAVWIRGSAIYRAEGLPDFALTLEETARFEGDRIVHLEDRYSEAMASETAAFLREFGPSLGIDVELD